MDAEDSPLDESVRPDTSLIFNSQSPVTKEELLAALPERTIVDRLVYRYFNSNSPASRELCRVSLGNLANIDQDIIHKPTFQKEVCAKALPRSSRLFLQSSY